MVDGGSEGFRLHGHGRIVPILIVVIRSVIQIGVIVRIVGIPVTRPDKLLKKDTMVAMKETAVLIKCEGRRRREVTANSGSHPECRAGTVGNEPPAKTATVEPTAARGRVRRVG